jgi:TonB family protein
MLFECWICVAAAGVFGLPLDLHGGPPPQLPALMRYEPPAFPESLRLTTIRDGYATMMFTVGGDGRVEDAVGLEASHPAFIDAMRETLSKWRFQSAAGATTPRREVFRFDFRRTGIVTSMSHGDAGKSFFPETPAAHERPLRTLEWSQLTQPPQRITTATPKYPAALRKQSVAGFAVVSFVIDIAGAVRVPVVVMATEPLFGGAALEAVKQWRFAMPRESDEPVNVRVERSFEFGNAKRDE